MRLIAAAARKIDFNGDIFDVLHVVVYGLNALIFIACPRGELFDLRGERNISICLRIS